MTRDRELEKLRRELARSKQRTKIERTKLDIELEKRKIKKELFILKNPTVSRVGRGLKILGKKAGGVISRQAVLIKERQERETKIGKKRRTKSQGFDPLDFNF